MCLASQRSPSSPTAYICIAGGIFIHCDLELLVIEAQLLFAYCLSVSSPYNIQGGDAKNGCASQAILTLRACYLAT